MQLEEEMGRIIDALVAGRAVRRQGADWRLEGAPLAPAAVRALFDHKLVAAEGAAMLVTPPGRRFRTPDAPRRRRLAERPLRAGEGQRAARTVTVNLAESPLGWLRARGLVSERQLTAGERLAADWTRAQLAPRVTMGWNPAPVHGAHGPAEPLDPSTAQIAAKQRFGAALAAAGSGLADILWRVACAGEGLEAAERALGWPGRSGKVVLLIALDRLADHYGLARA